MGISFRDHARIQKLLIPWGDLPEVEWNNAVNLLRHVLIGEIIEAPLLQAENQ